jgi:hypothetical protein
MSTISDFFSGITEPRESNNFAIIQHMVLNLLRQEDLIQKEHQGKRLKAGWDTEHLGRILKG